MPFKQEQIKILASSGWAQCRSIVEAVAKAGLPKVNARYLADAFSNEEWAAAEHATHLLKQHFEHAPLADEVAFGVLLVPDPAKLDTRRAMDPHVRRDQLGVVTADVFDVRLPKGTLGVAPGRDWTLVATVTGRYGLPLGSYDDVIRAPKKKFVVDGQDTRRLMIRQLWGSRVLQCGTELPDCEANQHWTFTLFPGEKLVGGYVESGTVLKGKIRFRLGKSNRGIVSARVAPALALSPVELNQ